MSDPAKSPVKPTLDDLFAVKRAERPDEAFWHDFERGLRQKQLAAIVLPRPWWHAPSLWARKAAPYGGFAAAAAALAVAFTTLRSPVEFDGRSSTRAVEGQRVSSVSAPTVDMVAAETSAAGAASSAEAVAVVATSDPVVGLAGVGSTGASDSAPVSSAEQAPTPVVTLAGSESQAPLSAPDAFVAEPVRVENLTVTPAVALADATDLAAAPADGLVIEPPAVLQTRHDRLLVKALEDAPGADDRSLAQVRERVVHRLADGEELYASITRVGVSGDRLSLKF